MGVENFLASFFDFTRINISFLLIFLRISIVGSDIHCDGRPLSLLQWHCISSDRLEYLVRSEKIIMWRVCPARGTRSHQGTTQLSEYLNQLSETIDIRRNIRKNTHFLRRRFRERMGASVIVFSNVSAISRSLKSFESKKIFLR